jgi:hypothetical protein
VKSQTIQEREDKDKGLDDEESGFKLAPKIKHGFEAAISMVK